MTHQYYFPEEIAERLGVDRGNYDESFAKQWLIDNIIHTMPEGVSISNLNPNIFSNNIQVTFTDGTRSKEIKLHLGKKDTVAEANEANAKGGLSVYRYYNQLKTSFNNFMAKLKALVRTIKDPRLYDYLIDRAIDKGIELIMDSIKSLLPSPRHVQEIIMVGAIGVVSSMFLWIFNPWKFMFLMMVF